MTQPKIDGVGHGVPRMLFASDGSNWYAILVDSDGHVKIDVVSYPGSNALGNFSFGYYDRYCENANQVKDSAGWTYVYGTAVPSGEIWVVTGMYVLHNDTVAREIACGFYDASYHYETNWSTSSAPLARVRWDGTIVLKAGDKVFGGAVALADGKIIQIQAWGYKMKIA